ncbi:HTTM domain-containing protein [Arenibacter algicola]|uniref:Vitamin K-dependent gamma-carboxylase n=1 Tax=Arenibacter algicola TaxID=616991 RepID=A0A221UVG3_9FLAO|nr:HTTM domain-containing protein [Arenibacter algicola]ASO05337.1 vitamin K-dependent gamma-carboxylase [Arenibacter algicola]
MLDRFLFKQIDNSPVLIFRIFFGILVSLECYGAIATGWVKKNLIDPEFTFNFIGLDWLQPLPGIGMYLYFIVMGTLGIFIALGYRYRFSAGAFALLWTAVYLMQKTAYNNHYYLLILIALIMAFMPANRDYSLDARRNPSIRTNHMSAYLKWAIVLQLFIVYTYASVAKLYGDWLDFSIIEILFKNKKYYPIIGGLLQEPLVHRVVGISGILFDLLIVPALLWKPTRKWAFVASLFFHLFNSIVFQIGIFPYLALAFTVFFFEPETIRKLFFKKKEPYLENVLTVPPQRELVLGILSLYFLIQLVLPIRHYFIEDDVLWTEEGHRMSWRMMLRSRTGITTFKIVNHTTGNSYLVNLDDYLSRGQKSKIKSYPDFMWQFAQRLRREYTEKGEDISVFVNSRVSINGKPYQEFIDPKIDLGNVSWNYFGHNDWILPSPSKN